MAERLDVDPIDDSRLDAAFRTLREAHEPAGLAGPAAVRRRGDHRRRGARAGALVAVAVLAVATVGVVEATRAGNEGGVRPIPVTTPTPSVTPAKLAADPLLAADAIEPIGPYAGFRALGPAALADLSASDCWTDSFGTQGPGSVQRVEREVYSSDLEATLILTAAQFNDTQSARNAASQLAAGCTAGPGPGTTIQHRQLTRSLDGTQTGLVTIPPGDAGISYLELACASDGPVLVALQWASMGLPHGEDATTARTWRWALSEDLLARALATATG